MTYYVCSLPQSGEPGEPKELFTDDLALAERFIEAEDKRPGRGVFQCINPLVSGARRRSLETVSRLQFIYFDLDLQNIEASHDEVIKQLRGLPVEFIWVRDSGFGNLHVGIEIKDAPGRDTPEYARVLAVWKRLAEKLAADPAPVHPAALIRCVNTHNKKNGGNGLCRPLWNGGGPLDVTELEELDDLLAEPLLTRKPKPTGAPHAGPGEPKGPVDVEVEFAGMTDGASTNAAQTRIIPSLLRKGEHPDDVLELVVDRTMAQVGVRLNWTREAESKVVRSRIIAAYGNLLLKDYDPTTGVIPSWLPGAFHEVWAAKLQAGQRPVFGFNSSGFYVRKQQGAVGDEAEERTTRPKGKADAAGSAHTRVILRPFVPVDPASLPRRQWLYGRHYQRRVVSATIAPGGTGKTSLAMVEAVALATCRNLLDEQPEARCRVWLHNGEDSREELNRRIVAICQHYKIPQEELQDWLFLTSGTEMALKVANGYGDLKVDSALVAEMTRVIADNSIDVVMFDPLVTLHSVNESDNGKMDTVIRIFSKLADVCDCAVDISHHTRKLAAGSFDHTVDDTRGASSVRDAVRMLRILNIMSHSDAENLGFDDFERLSYFRVDRGKANSVAPASTATWRKFESIELVNGDNVGVVTPWDLPEQDTPDDQHKAEKIFLQLLDQYTASEREVNDRRNRNYAPTLFAKEAVACAAKLSRAKLEAAMRRLFSAGTIRCESYGRSDRPQTRIVKVVA